MANRPLYRRALENRAVQEAVQALQQDEGLPPPDENTVLRWNERHYLRLVARSLRRHKATITHIARADKCLAVEVRRCDETGAARAVQVNLTGTHGFLGHSSSPITPSNLARMLAAV